jgi:pyrroloquinoline quinone (PQQ) biosynthesis protein C
MMITTTGIGTMNEPFPGYIGWPSLNDLWKGCNLAHGLMPTPLQQFALASGHTVKVATYHRTGTKRSSESSFFCSQSIPSHSIND